MIRRTFEELLEERLQQPLPGSFAQARMEPEGAAGKHFEFPPDARAAAVCICLFPDEEGVWRFPLTVRAPTLSMHPGQVSLPGGRIEPGETAVEAALREMEEELGVSASEVRLLGSLSPIYVTASRHRIAPCVAFLPSAPTWRPSPAEVCELLEPKLESLFDASAYSFVFRPEGPRRLRVPCWRSGRYMVWGATAMILAELAAVVDPRRAESCDRWRCAPGNVSLI